MNKRVGIIKRALFIGLVFLLNINVMAAIVSDNDGSAFITKAEFDSLKNNFQTQIDQYNTSIDSKIDGAIASYLSGITLSKITAGTTIINPNVYKNIRFKYASCYESPQIPFNGEWGNSYARPGAGANQLPYIGKSAGATLNTAKNKVPQTKDGVITGESRKDGTMRRIKQSTGASYDGSAVVAGCAPTNGMRDFSNLLSIPCHVMAWESADVVAKSNCDVLNSLGWTNPVWGQSAIDSWAPSFYNHNTADTDGRMRVTQGGIRQDKLHSDMVFPGTTTVDNYFTCKSIILGLDKISNKITYCCANWFNNVSYMTFRVQNFVFESAENDLIAGNVLYPPTELIMSDLNNPGDVTMAWSNNHKSLDTYLEVGAAGWIGTTENTSAKNSCTNYWSVNWSALPDSLKPGPDFLTDFYKAGTTTVSGRANVGQTNYLEVENVWYEQSANPLYKRMKYDIADMSQANTKLLNYIDTKGIYNGVPLAIANESGTMKIGLPTKVVSGTNKFKVWVTNGPIEDNGDLRVTASGIGYVTNKYQIRESSEPDKSIHVTSSTAGTTTSFSITVSQDDVVYLHIIPDSDVANTEITVDLSAISIEIEKGDT